MSNLMQIHNNIMINIVPIVVFIIALLILFKSSTKIKSLFLSLLIAYVWLLISFASVFVALGKNGLKTIDLVDVSRNLLLYCLLAYSVVCCFSLLLKKSVN